MRLIDTNIIIRYLTKDDPVKAAACHRLIHDVKTGKDRAETTESVIAEAVYILSSSKHYNLSHDDVVTNLAPVVQLRGLTVPRKRILLRALALYKQYRHLDFEDCINATTVQANSSSAIVSYDRGYDKIPGLTRQEP